MRVQHLNPLPSLTGVCAGYEAGEWRAKQLADHLLHWLPEFALKHSEREGIGAHNAVEAFSRAAKLVYASKKYKNRGEVGELLLHVMVRQIFKSVPAISKLYYKDSANDTVKGFDAVHVVMTKTSLELWLGEVKFYMSIKKAIANVVEELKAHTKRNYMRGECAAIVNKIDDGWRHAARLKKLLHPNTSLDKIFDAVCVPVLLTYNSKVMKDHKQVTQQFQQKFEAETLKHHDSFKSNQLPSNVRIHLLLFPMKDKKALLDAFDRKLKQCQAIV